MRRWLWCSCSPLPRGSQSHRLRFRFCVLGRAGFCCLFQGLFELGEEFDDVSAPDDERRKQTQDVFVRAINEQAATQRLGDDWSTVNREINAEDQAFAADFADEIEAGGDFFNSLAQLGAAFTDVREEI